MKAQRQPGVRAVVLADEVGVLVVDGNGKPLSDAFVLITEPNGSIVKKGFTTGNGSMQFDFASDASYDVTVVCPKHGMFVVRREAPRAN